MSGIGMVCAPQPEAAEAGVEILNAGGNAIDAALACAFVQGVVDPLMCGIAGFGSLGVYVRGGAHEYIDFHAPAPLAATPTMWEDLLEGEARDGFRVPAPGRVNDLGYGSICVPAALRAYEDAHRFMAGCPGATCSSLRFGMPPTAGSSGPRCRTFGAPTRIWAGPRATSGSLFRQAGVRSTAGRMAPQSA
jgi:gamma-glutamyltranspeptidase/glutathione hydrolase